MNRVLIRREEVAPDGGVVLRDRRAAHLAGVLRVEVGQTVRIGLLNGPFGTGRASRLGPGRVDLQCAFEPDPPPRSAVSLLLALPRPKVLKRVWPILAAAGVRRVLLTRAAKVERNYFDTHWLKREYYEPLLIEGLEQSGDTWLPEVEVFRRFRPAVEDELDGLCPGGLRLVAHPEEGSPFPRVIGAQGGGGVLIAVGPEGGWTAFELGLLESRRFRRVSLGWRRLRSDSACLALVTLAHAAMAEEEGSATRPL